MLATPTSKICKEKKSGVLIDSKDVTVVGPMEDQAETANVENMSSAQLLSRPVVLGLVHLTMCRAKLT